MVLPKFLQFIYIYIYKTIKLPINKICPAAACRGHFKLGFWSTRVRCRGVMVNLLSYFALPFWFCFFLFLRLRWVAGRKCLDFFRKIKIKNTIIKRKTHCEKNLEFSVLFSPLPFTCGTALCFSFYFLPLNTCFCLIRYYQTIPNE